MQQAFKSGSVMAYFVVAFSLLGINICYTWLGRDDNDAAESLASRKEVSAPYGAYYKLCYTQHYALY